MERSRSIRWSSLSWPLRSCSLLPLPASYLRGAPHGSTQWKRFALNSSRGEERMKVLYTAEVTAVGARAGHATSSDRLLDVALALPPEMGGKGGATNPEQLFAAGYAACFGGAVEYIAGQKKIRPGTVTVKAQVGIGPFDPGKGEGFSL